MPINDQLDDNAADLRNVETAPQPLESNVSSPSSSGSSKRSVSRLEIIIATSILIGFVIIIYLFLHRPNQSAPTQVPDYMLRLPSLKH